MDYVAARVVVMAEVKMVVETVIDLAVMITTMPCLTVIMKHVHIRGRALFIQPKEFYLGIHP